MDEKFTETIIWQDIPIKVSCIRDWPIKSICHIEVRADQQLPITNTGYLSHFMKLEYLDAYDSYVDYVRAWLDEAGQAKEWKQYIELSRQGDLFDL